VSRPPDFRELVGDAGTSEELARLRRVHDLLVAAGPPPEGELPAAPAPPQARVLPFRLPSAQTALRFAAAASIAVAFGVGFLVGNQDEGFPSHLSVSLHGVGTASGASAVIKVGGKDQHGNWPMLLKARGLPRLEKGYFELYLTKDGRRHASCGTFSAGTGLTVVRLNAPYYTEDYGWVLVAHRLDSADQVVLST
jgi:hypothetical protein